MPSAKKTFFLRIPSGSKNIIKNVEFFIEPTVKFKPKIDKNYRKARQKKLKKKF